MSIFTTTTSSDALGVYKRAQAVLAATAEERKRARIQPFAPQKEMPSYTLGLRITSNDTENDVKMSDKTYNLLFPRTHGSKPYIIIGGRVWQVVMDRCLPQDFISVTPSQCENLTPYIYAVGAEKCVTSSVFDPSQTRPNVISNLTLTAEIVSPKALGRSEIFDGDSFRNFLRQELNYVFVQKNQVIHVKYNQLTVKLTATGIDMETYEDFPYAIVNANTEYTIQGKGFALLDTVISGETKFTVRTTVENYPPDRLKNVFPVAIDLSELNEAVREYMGNRIFLMGESFTIKMDNGYDLGIKFESATSEDVVYQTYPLNSKVGFKIKPIDRLFYQPIYVRNKTLLDNVKEIVFTKGEPEDADKAVVKIVNVTGHPIKSRRSVQGKMWVNIEELREKLIQHQDYVADKQFLSFDTSCGNVTLKITEIPKDGYEAEKSVKKLWIFNMATHFKFNKVDANFILVDNNNKVPLTKIKVEIDGRIQDGTVLKEQEILEKLKAKLKKNPIVKDQVIKITLEDGQKITAVVKEADYDRKAHPSTHGVLGELNDDTKIEMETSPTAQKELKISKMGLDITPENAVEKLKELGIGGISKQFEELLLKVYYPTKFKAYAEKSGIKPIKGILFYGPPGTGKTSLAKVMGKILGVEEARTKMINATETFIKWVGDSEKFARDLFEPAKNDPKNLHMVVIDEIDVMISHRASDNDSSGVTKKVVAAFLSAMDGLKTMDNLIVVGTTNRREAIDEAALRPGRLELQLEITKPDEKGRLEIFEINAKKCKVLSPEINWKKLAAETKDFSGAEIEGLFKKVIGMPMGRLVKLRDISDTDLADHPDGLITEADFMAALETYTKKEVTTDRYFS